MSRALFFDRDGTLNEEVGHLVRLADLRLLPGAPEAVAAARAAGFRTVLVTNQSGVARGLMTVELVVEANRRVAEACGGFDAVYFCPHHPTAGGPEERCACTCRKPEPGMLLRARDELGVDLAASFVIGDSQADLGAARGAGAGAILVLTGNGRDTLARTCPGAEFDHVAEDVLAAVRWAVWRVASQAVNGERR